MKKQENLATEMLRLALKKQRNLAIAFSVSLIVNAVLIEMDFIKQ